MHIHLAQDIFSLSGFVGLHADLVRSTNVIHCSFRIISLYLEKRLEKTLKFIASSRDGAFIGVGFV